jgi:hypothetical protein
MKMMKKIANVKSELSKKKMDEFNNQMTRYSRIKWSSRQNIGVIDNLFYKNYRVEMMRGRANTIT